MNLKALWYVLTRFEKVFQQELLLCFVVFAWDSHHPSYKTPVGTFVTWNWLRRPVATWDPTWIPYRYTDIYPLWIEVSPLQHREKWPTSSSLWWDPHWLMQAQQLRNKTHLPQFGGPGVPWQFDKHELAIVGSVGKKLNKENRKGTTSKDKSLSSGEISCSSYRS